jgi:hypothetical protein
MKKKHHLNDLSVDGDFIINNINEECYRLVCDAMQSNWGLAIFRKTVLPQSSGLKSMPGKKPQEASCWNMFRFSLLFLFETFLPPINVYRGTPRKTYVKSSLNMSDLNENWSRTDFLKILKCQI